jgi:predicted SprT family Zn-dependent metalloprotease
MKEFSTVRNKNIEAENSKPALQNTKGFSKPTLLQFNALQKAYDFYNVRLFKPVFGELLPPVMLSLNDNHKNKYLGYYAFDRYVDENGTILSLINITPEHLNRSFTKVMSTLVHEMCHHYQYNFGVKKGRRSPYHNLEYARIMERVGLICSNTGQIGGKQTGIQMTHYILEKGKFEKLTLRAPQSLKTPFTLNKNVFRREESDQRDDKIKAQKQKIKYECPLCNTKVWGKPNLEIRCIPCNANLL